MRSLFFDTRENPAPTWLMAIHIALIGLVLSLICVVTLTSSTQAWDAVWRYRLVFFHGWLATIAISACALVLSLVIGVATALARRSTLLPLRGAAVVYIELIRGTPLLVQILFLFYVIANAANLDNRYVAGVIILALFSGAYIAEMIRAGIESIPKSQLESARAIGLTTVQTYRYVIFPQALRQTLPPLAGQFASLIKDSSLLMIVGIQEFTLAAQQANSATLATIESYIPLAVGYLILTLPISLWSRHLEKRFAFES